MDNNKHRLSYSLNFNKITINDNLQAGVILYEDGHFMSFSIDKDVVIQELQNIIQSIMRAKRSTMFRITNKPAARDALVINEDGYYIWRMAYQGKGAYLTHDTLKMEIGFDIDRVISFVNKALAEVIRSDQILTPRVDIVRRISDAGLLVWVWQGHSIVCYESSVEGSTMHDCLIDGVYYPLVVVSVSEEKGTCVLLTLGLQEIVTYPLDASITYFYKADEHLFDEEDTDNGTNGH